MHRGLHQDYNGKRSLYDGVIVERNVLQKSRNQRRHISCTCSHAPPNVPLGDDVVFRILCPSQRTGCLIGEGGSIRMTLRQDSGVNVQVVDGSLGTNESIIIISAVDSGNLLCERGRNCGKEEDWKEEELFNCDGETLSAAQEVLFKVHARIVALDNEEDSSQQVVLRILINIDHTSFLLGESFSSQICVLRICQCTGCPMANNVIVEVCGDTQVVQKALLFISSRLQDNLTSPRLLQLCDQSKDCRFKEGPESGENDLVFRILCPIDKVGMVIGMQGRTISRLRRKTGARIIINDVVFGCDERIITVSACELSGDSYSPALEAVTELQCLIISEMDGDKDKLVTTRLLVPSNQISCLIGKERRTIEEMRRVTQANIHLLPKDNFPPCASISEDELVEIMGNTTVARKALIEVLSKLRDSTCTRKPVKGGGGVCHYGRSSTSSHRDNCSGSHGIGGRMGSRSLCKGVSSMSGLHSSSSFGRHSSPDVVGEEKSQQTNRDSIRRVAESILAEKMESISGKILAETVAATMASVLKDTCT